MDQTTKDLRLALGILGLVLPVLSFIFGLITWSPAMSISDTHYNPQYLIFEGIMVAVGLFLITYRGYDIGDRVSTIIGGVCGLLLAYFPTNGSINWNFACIPSNITYIIHMITAIGFFIAMAYISAFRFTKTADKLLMTKQKKIRNAIYITCGVMMLVSIFAGGAIDFFVRDKVENWIIGPLYIGEWLGLWFFSASWIVKGELVFKDK